MIPEIKYKQFVIIPKNPKMSAGKIASQTAHATFMALEEQRQIIKDEPDFVPEVTDLIDKWKANGMCVIVLECRTPLQLMGIAKYLEQWKIPNHLYIDEGLTEVSMGTPTALATGVLTEEDFWMLGQLRLYHDMKPKGWFK